MDTNLLSAYEHLKPGPPKAPPALQPIYCYICGRQFGSKSIGIHQPQCLKKWHLQNEQLPKELRRSAPPEPPKIIRKADDSIDVEATNLAAYEASLAQLVPCANCGRKIAPERMQAHQRACTKENPVDRIDVHPGRHHHQPKLATTMAKRTKQK